jgi:branched-chain amino acid aminotransferase
VTTTVWVNGWLGEAAEAMLPAIDHAVTVGDGVFETCKVVDGDAFALTRHLRRLARSAELLGLQVPAESLLRDAVGATLAAQPERFGRLRITVTGGAGPLGSDRAGTEPGLVVAVGAARPWPAEVVAVSVPWTRNERSAIAGAKSTSYAENVVALRRAREQGAHEALLANTRGELCEGTGSNVVLVLQGQLVTPPLSSGCLAGITRELLLEWAREDGLDVEQRPLEFEVLASADDVLLTGSTRDVQRVHVLDGRRPPGSRPGTAAVELFASRAAADLDP